MSDKRAVLFAVALLCLFAVAPTALYSQLSSTSGLVTGVVMDPSKAVVPGAEVTLQKLGTGVVQTTVSNNAGVYVFPAVAAGDYTLRCSAKGFRTSEVGGIHVNVLKSYTVDITLELGTPSEVVEVTAAPGAELQTTNASIGTVLGGEMVLRLPAQQRSVTSYLMLQPGVSPPGNQGDDVNGGQVGGALTDQSVFFVDGGDATSDLEGTNNYVSPPGEPQPAPFIAVPAETVQEFRVVTASPTSSFARSQGGEVAVVTKSGSNALHGSAYEYYYGSGTSGNSWLNNSLGFHRPHQVNNRYGTSVGAPIIKDKLFIYGNYEARRFYQNLNITQLVPTDSVRQGILTFKDGTGANVAYNLKTSTACSAAGGSACDPRGLGISPLIQNYFKLLPAPNNFSTGDGLNSAGFTGNFATPFIEDLAVVRLDYNINSKWSVFGTYHYNRYRLTTSQQFDITAGQTPHIVSGTPVEPRFVTFMLTGQVSPHFTSQTHGSYMHDWWNWNRQGLAPQLPGTAATLQISGEARLAGLNPGNKVWGDPVNFDTQDARSRVWGGKDWFVAQDSTWLHGAHTIQFGGSYYFWDLLHSRTDVVTGGLTNGPIYWVGQTNNNGGSFLKIPAGQTPPTCGSADYPGMTNCLTSSNQAKRWANMYGSLLGLLDRASQVGTRNGDFIANPLGSPLVDHVHTHSFETYVQDSWKVKPSFTLTYGLSYGVQFAPHELDGKQVLEVFANNNQPLSNLPAYFQQRHAALSSGGFFASGLVDPVTGKIVDKTFGFSPVGHIPGRSSSAPTQWNNFGPRVAVAWNLPFNNRIFGNKNTVVRLGYSILWNRTNAVGEVLTPLLGNGLASVDVCGGPTFNGTTTATCSGSSVNAVNGFRIGVDGSTVPIPPFTNAPIPLVGTGAAFGVSRATVQDPAIRLPYSHNVSFDIQRAFAHNWLIDIGYIGRFARKLWQNVDVNAADPFAKTPGCSAGAPGCIIPTSGQTLAQAYNAFNASGGAAQPFFENAPYGCLGCTAKLVKAGEVGDVSLSNFMLFNYNSIALRPLDPMQFVVDNVTTSGGISNYNAMFVSVRKSVSQGLDLSVNYTWSHSVGTSGQTALGQQYTFYSPPSSFDFFTGWGSNNGDRRHVLNATWLYRLPFGKGRHFATSNGVLDRVIGGWYVSGIWVWGTGRPVCIGADGDYGAVDGFSCALGNLFGQASARRGVTGSGGVGTNTKTKLNIFANPEAAFKALSTPLPGVDGRPGAEALNEPRFWNVDLGIGKNILATERFKIVITAEMFNTFNHPLFGTNLAANNCSSGNICLDLSSKGSFGVVPKADNTPRQIQLGVRFEF